MLRQIAKKLGDKFKQNNEIRGMLLLNKRINPVTHIDFI
jgi:hypothetical protein